MAQLADTFSINGWMRLSAILKTAEFEGRNDLRFFSIRNRDAAVECVVKMTKTSDNNQPTVVSGVRLINREGWSGSELDAARVWIYAASAIDVDITVSD